MNVSGQRGGPRRTTGTARDAEVATNSLASLARTADSPPTPHRPRSRALPGVWIDLLTDGVHIGHGGRQPVIKAVRQIMLAAHRLGITYTDLHPLLTDVKRRRLAAQLATGRGGRPIAPGQRERLLRALWDDTAKVAASSPPWTRDDACAAIQHVRDALDDADDLDPSERAVMRAVIDLAEAYGTTRVAAPVRRVAQAAGLTTPTAHRVLKRLCDGSGWLSLAKRGDRLSRRSNLYRVGPALLAGGRMGGLRPPTSQAPPTSHPPTSHPGSASDMAAASVTFDLDPAQAAEVAALVARLKRAEADPPEQPEHEWGAEVVSIDRHAPLRGRLARP